MGRQANVTWYQLGAPTVSPSQSRPVSVFMNCCVAASAKTLSVAFIRADQELLS